MRPSVVLFGESLPQTALEQAEEWTNVATPLDRGADMVIQDMLIGSLLQVTG